MTTTTSDVVHVSELSEDGHPLLQQYLQLKSDKDTGSKFDDACFVAEGRETVSYHHYHSSPRHHRHRHRHRHYSY